MPCELAQHVFWANRDIALGFAFDAAAERAEHGRCDLRWIDQQRQRRISQQRIAGADRVHHAFDEAVDDKECARVALSLRHDR